MAEEAPQSFSSLISEFIINFTASKGQIDNQLHQLHHHLELTVDSRLDFPRFDGSSDGSAGIEWIIRANHFFDYFKTVDDNRLTIAYYHMDGRALEWIQKGQPYQSWNEFSKDFVYWMGPSNWDEQRGIEFIESLSSGYDRSLHVRENVHSIFFHPKLEIEEPKLQNNNDLPIKSSELPSNCKNSSKTLSHYPLSLYMKITTYAKVMEKLMLGGHPPIIRCNAEMTTMKYIGYVRMGNWNPYGSSKIVEVKLSTLGFGRVYLHRYLYEICCMGKEEKLAAVRIRTCELPLLHGRPPPLPDDALQQQVPFFKPAISNLDPHAQWKVLLQETEFSLNGSVGEEVLGIDLEHDKQVSTLLDPKLEVGGLSTTEPLTNLEWTHSDIESNSNKKTTNVGERKDYIFDPGGSLACIARPLKSIFLSIHHLDIEDSIYEFDDKVVQDQMNAHHIIVAHSMNLASTSTLLQSTALQPLHKIVIEKPHKQWMELIGPLSRTYQFQLHIKVVVFLFVGDAKFDEIFLHYYSLQAVHSMLKVMVVPVSLKGDEEDMMIDSNLETSKINLSKVVMGENFMNPKVEWKIASYNVQGIACGGVLSVGVYCRMLEEATSTSSSYLNANVEIDVPIHLKFEVNNSVHLQVSIQPTPLVVLSVNDSGLLWCTSQYRNVQLLMQKDKLVIGMPEILIYRADVGLQFRTFQVVNNSQPLPAPPSTEATTYMHKFYPYHGTPIANSKHFPSDYESGTPSETTRYAALEHKLSSLGKVAKANSTWKNDTKFGGLTSC